MDEIGINNLINTFTIAIRANPIIFEKNLKMAQQVASNLNMPLSTSTANKPLPLNASNNPVHNNDNQLVDRNTLASKYKRKFGETDTTNSFSMLTDEMDNNYKLARRTSSPKTINKSFSSINKHKTYITKFKSLSKDPETTMKPFTKLRDEIAKLFKSTSIQSAYIDRDHILIVKTNSINNQNEIQAVNATSAFTSGLELIKSQPKYYVAIHNVEIENNLDETAIRDILRDDFKISETKRLTKKGEKLRTVKALITDRDMFEKITGEGKILIFPSSFPITKWNFNNSPDQCYKCQKFGHTYHACKSEQACLRCGGDHKKDDCTLSKGQPFKCINCVRNKCPQNEHTAVSKSCPSMIAHMSKKTTSTNNVVRKYSEAASNNLGTNLLNNRAIVNINQRNSSNMQKMVLLFLEMFKNINDVQSDLESENPTYIPGIIKYYLGEDTGNQIIDSLIAINQNEKEQAQTNYD